MRRSCLTMARTVSVACSSIPTCCVKSTPRKCCDPIMKCSANFSVALGILYRAVDNASMSSRSSPVIKVLTSCSLISSAMRFSFRRDNTKSSKVGGPLELLMIRTNACTLLRASSALASSKSKNLSPLPNTCCRENIAPPFVTQSSSRHERNFRARRETAERRNSTPHQADLTQVFPSLARLRDSNRSGIPPAADEEEVRDVQKQD